MRDRFINGLIAGVIGGIAMNIINYFAYYLKLSNFRYVDWAAVLVFGHRPLNIWEIAFSQVVQLLFSGLMGIILAYLFSIVKSRYYLTKGVFFSVISWFIIYSIGIVLKLPFLTIIPFKTSLTNFIGSIVFGLVTSEALRRLDRVHVD